MLPHGLIKINIKLRLRANNYNIYLPLSFCIKYSNIYYKIHMYHYRQGVEPEWLLEPPPTTAARVRSPGLAPGAPLQPSYWKKNICIIIQL